LRNLGIRVFGGLTLSDFQYTTDDLGTFSDYFHAGSSAGGGVAVDFNFKKQKWSVGLGWLDYAQRLEFEQTWQTEFVDPAGLISIDVDPISGDTLAVETGPVLVTASHHRHFRNYNHVNALVIPFEWRKEWLIARWTLEVDSEGNCSFAPEHAATHSRKKVLWMPIFLMQLRLMMPTCRTLGSPGLPLHGYTWDFNSNPNGGWTLR